MKNYFRVIVLSLLAGLVLMACSEESGDDYTLKSIKIANVTAGQIELLPGEDFQLEITTKPSNIMKEKLLWKSSSEAVATISYTGKIHAYNAGQANITVSSLDGKVSASCIVIVKTGNEEIDLSSSGQIDGHEYVDLGLSVKWATCNIGANSPEDAGEYYAWQDTQPYTEWTWVNYDFYFNPCDKDNILSSRFDAVTYNWGRSWRMPTYDEQEELRTQCIWTWVDNIFNSGMSGYVVKSKKNGKQIFLPAAKYKAHENYLTPSKVEGWYWSSWGGVQDLWKNCPTAHCLYFFDKGVEVHGSIANRGDGLSIRGVVGKPNDYLPFTDPKEDTAETKKQGYTVNGSKDGRTYVDLGLPSRTLWATYNVGASAPADYGTYFAWGETEGKSSYVQENYKFYIGNSDKGPNYWAQYSKYIYMREHGNVDNKLILDDVDDAATANWGKNWSMPTTQQVEELANYCIWYVKSIIVDGKKIQGYEGRSKINDNRIFIPSAGWEYSTEPNTHLHAWYWTKNLSGNNNASGTDYRANFFTFNNKDEMEVKDTSRMQGLTVRAVTK